MHESESQVVNGNNEGHKILDLQLLESQQLFLLVTDKSVFSY